MKNKTTDIAENIKKRLLGIRDAYGKRREHFMRQLLVNYVLIEIEARDKEIAEKLNELKEIEEQSKRHFNELTEKIKELVEQEKKREGMIRELNGYQPIARAHGKTMSPPVKP